MKRHQNPNPPLDFKPKFSWPESPAILRECPKCGQSLELIEKTSNYYGKPWWCPACQWQFAEEDFSEPKADQALTT